MRKSILQEIYPHSVKHFKVNAVFMHRCAHCFLQYCSQWIIVPYLCLIPEHSISPHQLFPQLINYQLRFLSIHSGSKGSNSTGRNGTPRHPIISHLNLNTTRQRSQRHHEDNLLRWVILALDGIFRLKIKDAAARTDCKHLDQLVGSVKHTGGTY